MMPVYCYAPKKGKGKVVEQLHPIGKAPNEILVDGVPYERNIQLEHSGRARPGDIWPLHSESAGVLPNQIGEATEHYRKLGVPTDFDSEGRAVFTSASHRRKFLRASGMFDKQGFD